MVQASMFYVFAHNAAGRCLTPGACLALKQPARSVVFRSSGNRPQEDFSCSLQCFRQLRAFPATQPLDHSHRQIPPAPLPEEVHPFSSTAMMSSKSVPSAFLVKPCPKEGIFLQNGERPPSAIPGEKRVSPWSRRPGKGGQKGAGRCRH